jgi:hypothetical protein
MLTTCPNCSNKLMAPEHLAGKWVICPVCSTSVPVPFVSDAEIGAPAHPAYVEAPQAVLPVFTPLTDTRPAKPKNLLPLAIALGAIACILAIMIVGVIAIKAARHTSVPAVPARQAVAQRDLPVRGRDEKPRDEHKQLSDDDIKRMLNVAFASAEDLADEFSLNALAATEKYRGRMVRITGEVLAVTNNKDGLPLVLLRTDSVWVVRVFITKETVPAAAKFQIGDEVALLTGFGGVGGSTIDFGGGVVSDEKDIEWLKGSRKR